MLAGISREHSQDSVFAHGTVMPLQADALSGMRQNLGGKYGSAKEAKAAKIEAAIAKREMKAVADRKAYTFGFQPNV